MQRINNCHEFDAQTTPPDQCGGKGIDEERAPFFRMRKGQASHHLSEEELVKGEERVAFAEKGQNPHT